MYRRSENESPGPFDYDPGQLQRSSAADGVPTSALADSAHDFRQIIRFVGFQN